ncbi:hypothetical protein BDR07DRAFT_1273858 [Suillus spraguei]|nr:hypothetical protein BDR07DRAFT_1273858 [Suillus spraguei]
MEGGSAGKSVLKVLKKCAIFVDVRTDDGDDAGGLFVDMLRGLGARILARVGQSCTHIVYKNGSASTLTRYRLLNDPKPLVVGIAWVVECVEQRSRVDEVKFKVDLEMVNIAGTNKVCSVQVVLYTLMSLRSTEATFYASEAYVTGCWVKSHSSQSLVRS